MPAGGIPGFWWRMPTFPTINPASLRGNCQTMEKTGRLEKSGDSCHFVSSRDKLQIIIYIPICFDAYAQENYF
jgi:hypothetical protein